LAVLCCVYITPHVLSFVRAAEGEAHACMQLLARQ